jgi:hypothetical protein
MFRLFPKKRRIAEPQPKLRRIEDELFDLSSRLFAFAAELEAVHNKAEAVLPYVIEKADQSLHIDRKARFTSYCDVLHTSIEQLAGSIGRLRSMREQCKALEQAVRSGCLDPATGQVEIIAIHQVFHSLDKEDSVDEVWLRGVRSVKREFDGVLRERDRNGAEQQRKRHGFKAEWDAVKTEKERMPKATGHRDSWNPFER